MDIRKILEEINNTSSGDKEEQIMRRLKTEFDALTGEQKEKVKKEFSTAFDEKIEESKEALKDVDLKIEMLKVSKYVNLSQIAKNYFGKSKAWLYQRIYGYNVNGKPAKLTNDERKKLAMALEDISKLIHESSFKIA